MECSIQKTHLGFYITYKDDKCSVRMMMPNALTFDGLDEYMNGKKDMLFWTNETNENNQIIISGKTYIHNSQEYDINAGGSFSCTVNDNILKALKQFMNSSV